MVVLGIYTLVNIIATFMIIPSSIINAFEYKQTIHGAMHDWCKNIAGINILGTIIFMITITLLFLPAILFVYIMMNFIFIFSSLWKFYKYLFAIERKKDNGYFSAINLYKYAKPLDADINLEDFKNGS